MEQPGPSNQKFGGPAIFPKFLFVSRRLETMSLKFFFNRKGGVVTGLTVLGWILILLNLYRRTEEATERGMATGIAFVVFCVFCFFITITRFFPWYPKAFRGLGIEEHFEKTLVPTSYIMVTTAVVYRLWWECWPLLLFVSLLLAVIISVNFILLYFHFRDHDPLPPSYFAQNLHQTDK